MKQPIKMQLYPDETTNQNAASPWTEQFFPLN